MSDHRITLAEVQEARRLFEENEPRDLFYRAATELVDLALKRSTSLTVSEALAVLLQTWNREYYRFRKFDAQHFSEVANLLAKHQEALLRFRPARIETLSQHEETNVPDLFQAFETVLGPVGAAKALHLLAPRVFPLWDRAIAKAYKLALAVAGSNGDRYSRFMRIAREQCLELAGHGKLEVNPLKAVDEYNYCKYTKGWLK